MEDLQTEISKRVNKNGMVISRMPEWARKIIIEKSEKEHCGDYGACIAQMMRDALEYTALKGKVLNEELDVKLLVNSEKPINEEEELKFGNGKIMRRREI